MPSLLDYVRDTARLPPCITFSFAAYIAFYRDCPAQDDPWVLEFYQARKGDSPAQLVHAVIHNERMWGREMAALPGFEQAASAALERIGTAGAYEAMKAFARELTKYVPTVMMTVVDTIPPEEIENCRKICEEEIGAVYRVREYIAD